jgi:hypothetical protein
MGAIMHVDPFIYDAYKEKCAKMRSSRECVNHYWVSMNKKTLITISKVDYSIRRGRFVYRRKEEYN